MSIGPHATTQILLDEFSWKCFIGVEREVASVEKIQVLLKQDKNNRHFT
jgi:hypothetical protein